MFCEPTSRLVCMQGLKGSLEYIKFTYKKFDEAETEPMRVGKLPEVVIVFIGICKLYQLPGTCHPPSRHLGQPSRKIRNSKLSSMCRAEECRPEAADSSSLALQAFQESCLIVRV